MIEDPQVWINGGLTSIAILELGVIVFMVKMAYKLITNHMKHSDEVLIKLREVLQNNNRVMVDNTRILERMERKLDANGFK